MIKKIGSFFGEVRGELAKVSWSTREELIGSTIVVLTLTALLTIFIGFVDLSLTKILSIVFK